jgi:hypothetical protein
VGGRRIGRIIAQGSVASILARPVPVAPGGVRLFARIAHIEPTITTVRRFLYTSALYRPLEEVPGIAVPHGHTPAVG